MFFKSRSCLAISRKRTFGALVISFTLIYTYFFSTQSPKTNSTSTTSVVVKLHASLGNSLFRLASSYALSKSLGVPLYVTDHTPVFPGSWKLSEKQRESYRRTNLRFDMTDMFNIPFLKKENLIYDFPNKYKDRIKTFLCEDVYYGKIQTERLVDTILFSEDYCHSEEYFKAYKNQILQMLQFSQHFQDFTSNSKKLVHWKELLETAHKNGEITVGVHVRRGDFLTRPGNTSLYWVTPMEYFQKAINLMGSKFCGKKIHFLIFTDSFDLVKVELVLRVDGSICGEMGVDAEFYFVSNVDPANPKLNELSTIEEFYVLTRCLNAIISNSTWSWWAAYLIGNENKTVIGPKFHPRFLDHANEAVKSFKRFMQKYKYPEGWLSIDPFNGTGV